MPTADSRSFSRSFICCRQASRLPCVRLTDCPLSIGQRLFASLVEKALAGIGEQIRGALPDELQNGLSTFEALRYLHEPPSDADCAGLNRGESPGHLALAFDELFAFELALCLERERAAVRSGIALAGDGRVTSRWLGELPFALTGAQSRALGEIGGDLERPAQMNRMLLGDVGSGKTIVAFWAALRAVECGYQAAIMAPTELLAEQHHASFQSLCGKLGIAAGLLTAKVTGAARASTLRTLASGAMPIVFGTHAIIQERVKIRRLGLGVIDEQHRFGVFDRARLKALGAEANLLMMTATPIPRSLALSLFANLEVSFLDELPPGRTPITTEIFSEADLDKLDTIVREELRAGNRAYYVLPRIESADDADDDEVRSVTAMAERLKRGALGEYKIAILHGRMRASDKEAAMRDFRDGAIQVLVSTTVVEVGIDVPEASVIVIVAAERYGLAQLHQLRGRVGRGRAASRCFLVASREADETALERLTRHDRLCQRLRSRARGFADTRPRRFARCAPDRRVAAEVHPPGARFAHDRKGPCDGRGLAPPRSRSADAGLARCAPCDPPDARAWVQPRRCRLEWKAG